MRMLSLTVMSSWPRELVEFNLLLCMPVNIVQHIIPPDRVGTLLVYPRPPINYAEGVEGGEVGLSNF